MNGFVDEGLVFHLDIPVLDSDADVFEHANNTRYIHWMQSIAIAHSEFYGWDDKRYIEYGGGWFVRRHVVDYIHPVFPGEVLHGETSRACGNTGLPGSPTACSSPTPKRAGRLSISPPAGRCGSPK